MRDGADYLDAALASVFAQDYPHLEILISDNASSDRTPEICARVAATDSRVRWWRNTEDVGFGYNFALLAERATGDYFTWLAHDDLLSSPRFASTIVDYMERRPDVSLCASSLDLLDYDGPGMRTPVLLKELYDTEDQGEIQRRLVRLPQRSIYYACFGMYRRHVLKGFRKMVIARPAPIRSAFAEYHPLLLAAARGLIVALPDVLRTYRYRRDSVGGKWIETRPHATIFSMMEPNWWLLRSVLTAPLPVTSKTTLAREALGNFVRANYVDPGELRAQIGELKREIVTLHQACDERLALIHRLDAECAARGEILARLQAERDEQQRVIDGLTREPAPSGVTRT